MQDVGATCDFFLTVPSSTRVYGYGALISNRDPRIDTFFTHYQCSLKQLAIKGGRHPIVENVQSNGGFVANDTYACETSTFQIIHGPKLVSNHTSVIQVPTCCLNVACPVRLRNLCQYISFDPGHAIREKYIFASAGYLDRHGDMWLLVPAYYCSLCRYNY